MSLFDSKKTQKQQKSSKIRAQEQFSISCIHLGIYISYFDKICQSYPNSLNANKFSGT